MRPWLRTRSRGRCTWGTLSSGASPTSCCENSSMPPSRISSQVRLLTHHLCTRTSRGHPLVSCMELLCHMHECRLQHMQGCQVCCYALAVRLDYYFAPWIRLGYCNVAECCCDGGCACVHSTSRRSRSASGKLHVSACLLTPNPKT